MDSGYWLSVIGCRFEVIIFNCRITNNPCAKVAQGLLILYRENIANSSLGL